MIRAKGIRAIPPPKMLRSFAGTSLTELMVSVLIMGIAIAGLSEAAWLNTAWANLVQHKLDNQFNCRNFLSRIGKEIQMASAVIPTGNPLLDTTTLKLQIPDFTNPDPLQRNYKTVTYKVEPSASSASEFQITRAEGNNSGTVVLNGIIGPFQNTNISIFSYVDRLTSSQPNQLVPPNNITSASTPFGNTTIVIIDIDLASNNFATNRGAFGGIAKTKSAYSVRREFYLRNSNPHG